MAIIITFQAIPESHSKPEDDLEFVILKGNKGDILLRETMEDNLEGYPEIVYDTESSKVFRRPNRLSLLQGALKGTISWTGDEIEASDIDRFKALNKNSVFKESTTSEAIANKEYIFTYTYGVDYPTLYDARGKWALAAKACMEATADDTRFLCTRSATDYDSKHIDIDVGDTKTITKQQTTNYVYFPQKCSIGETDVPQFSVKKLTSDSVDITNKGEVPARIIIVSK
tara:strand:- start:55 stop:738 length:684 start_codon:yes stop_codon:yes gene_type:complete